MCGRNPVRLHAVESPDPSLASSGLPALLEPCTSLCTRRTNDFTLGAFAPAFPLCFLARCTSNVSCSGDLLNLHGLTHPSFPGPTHVAFACACVDLSTAPGTVNKVLRGQLWPLPVCIPSACATPGTKLVFEQLGEGEEKGKRGKK